MTARAAGTPHWIADILSWQSTWRLARIALVSAYLIGGVNKLLDFPAAVAEQAHFGLHPAWLWAAAAIVIEIGGSLLVVTGRLVWLGAGALGVLTAIAMLVANDFWSMTGAERIMALNTFFEHLGLVAGFVLVSIRAEEARP
ncbi:MAG: DoxX family protein [Acetobacteraceae bacterium]|nr:DoxX family protein [Acetobacteraceae bacterium]